MSHVKPVTMFPSKCAEMCPSSSVPMSVGNRVEMFLAKPVWIFLILFVEMLLEMNVYLLRNLNVLTFPKKFVSRLWEYIVKLYQGSRLQPQFKSECRTVQEQLCRQVCRQACKQKPHKGNWKSNNLRTDNIDEQVCEQCRSRSVAMKLCPAQHTGKNTEWIWKDGNKFFRDCIRKDMKYTVWM